MEFQDMIFLSEIVLQSKVAQRSAEHLQAANESFDQTEIWDSIQSILVATGNVSKILWPNKKYEKRGERLRQILKVEQNNPLNNRKFRNHFFEHYDELVEEWFKNHANGVYIDLAMNPSLYGGRTGNTHRGYNSFNNTLLFRGELFDLNIVLNALEVISSNCKGLVLES
ncbi:MULTISPECIES: hypothetical protein [unclassified Sphingobacterium]|uniref:hypothetical protein n=1 Tax=unclassified Sphingobacterium TaxID=2609468 RepID=UPI0025F50D6B|nr:MULTISPECIES: hypothetical protein [unclassified Sphingobacterium]